MNWQQTADGYHCTRHDERFGRGEVCLRCASDPGDAPGSSSDSPEIDRQLMARAHEYRMLARFLHRKGKEKMEGDTPNDWGVATKVIAEGTKLHRLADETEDRVSNRDHDRKLIEHEREMSGLRASH